MKNQDDELDKAKNCSEYNTQMTTSSIPIDNLNTSYEKSKIPYKKMNYKSLMYKKRINYGKLENCGLAYCELRILPELISNNNEYFNSYFRIKESKNMDKNQNIIEDNYNQVLINSCDEFIHPNVSRREKLLKQLLQNKLNEFIELSKYK